jgi:hypothetical protein
VTESTTPYYHWSSRNDSQSPPYNNCSPNLLRIQDFYRRTRGGTSLGCHVERSVSGGSTLSTHAWGAACDWLFPNRTVTVEAMGWTVAHSAELGVNTIHDYVTQTMWKPTVGWRPASIGSVGGNWIHVETTPAAFTDSRPVEDRLTGTIEGGGEEPMTPEDKAYLEGPYKDLLANDFVRILRAPEFRVNNVDDVVAATNVKVEELTKLVQALALAAGDPEAIAAQVTAIVREEIDKTLWQSRPLS